MAGDIDHAQRQSKRWDPNCVIFDKRYSYLRNAIRTRTEDWYREIFQQGGYAADMVSMVMCQ